MKHENKDKFSLYKEYWDTIEEIPELATVSMPVVNEKGETERKKLENITLKELYDLNEQGWKTIMHTVVWGSCDHWDSKPLKNWIEEKFLRFFKLIDNKNQFMGYVRQETYVVLTKEDVHNSSVWNS